MNQATVVATDRTFAATCAETLLLAEPGTPVCVKINVKVVRARRMATEAVRRPVGVRHSVGVHLAGAGERNVNDR